MMNIHNRTLRISRWLKQSLLCCVITSALIMAPAHAAFKVVGYFPSWAGDVNSIPYDRVTHINYSFVLPNHDGSLRPLDGGAWRLQSLVQRAHQHGVKVLIAVGGWNNGDDSAFRSLASNAGYRNNFVNQVVNFVNQYNLDGVDIDWEYPDGWEVPHYRTLMQQLSQAMHSRGKLLTAAVTATDFPGSVDGAVINSVDFLNLMVYDLGEPHSTYSAAQNALNHWKYNEGLPKDKAVLGVPFYSHKNWVSYRDVIARYGKWAAQVDNAGGLDYNGQPTIRAKSELALMEAGGVMFWEISQDTRDETSLMGTIWEVVGHAAGGNNDGGNNNDNDTGSYPDWRAGTWYNPGDIVRYNHQLYIAVHGNPGYDPVISHWFWDEYQSGGNTAAFRHGGIYKITAHHSGKALDVSGISYSNGANVHQWDYVGGNNQKWRALDKGDGYFQLQAVHSGKCLDVFAWSRSNGGNIIQWDCHNGANQQFKPESQGGVYYLRNRHSNKCLDVRGVSYSNGASIHQWDCVGQDNAKWKIESL
ncbi:MAG: glycosyl hydrolase family 18 protein [Ketobacteraceae bacterium]|nr:glycosyl hydrolase family 18 protein [Ketobacteraceae bacterium]